MKYYFKLWFKIRNHQLTDFGVPPLLAYPLIAGFFYIVTSNVIINYTYGSYFVALMPVSFISALSKTKKIEFLKLNFQKPTFYTIRLIENLLVCLPFLLTLLLIREFLIAGGLFVVSIVLVFANFNPPSSIVIPTPFGKHPFESLMGFRKYFWVFPITYGLCFIGIYVGNFNLGIFSLFINALVFFQFYSGVTEPTYFVWIFNLSSAEFIYYKIKMGARYLVLTTLPMAILLVLFNPSLWWLVLSVELIIVVYLALFILVKYAVFPRSIDLPGGLILLTAMVFPPLAIMLLPHFYNKATKSLKPFLHD